MLDEAAVKDHHDQVLNSVHLLHLEITNSNLVPGKLLKCAVAYQVKQGATWCRAYASEVHFEIMRFLACSSIAAGPNDPEAEEPPTKQPKREPELVGGLPVVDCSQDDECLAKILYVPIAAVAFDHVCSQAEATRKALEPNFFLSMAAFPGELGISIPLFEDPVAALVQLKFQVLAAHATGRMLDPTQWNSYSPEFDPFNFNELVLIEFHFKQSFWQKLHSLQILGKSRGCPIFHYKLAAPLPVEHTGYSWKACRANVGCQLGNHRCMKVS